MLAHPCMQVSGWSLVVHVLLDAARSVLWIFLLSQTTLPTTPECVSHCLSHWTLGCHELVTHEAQPTTPELVTHEAQPPNCVCE